MSSVNTLYKIIALYLMRRSEYPLTGANICEFFVDNGYADYFKARTVLSELKEASMVEISSTGSLSSYSLSQLGKDTLSAMEDKISSTINKDVEDFLKAKSISLVKNRDLYADYDKASYGGYVVHLRASEGKFPIMDLTLSVSGEEQAKSICVSWKSNYEEAYVSLISCLL